MPSTSITRADAARRLPRWLAWWLVVVVFGSGVLGAAHGVLHGGHGPGDARALAPVSAPHTSGGDAFHHSAGDVWCGVFDALCHGGPVPAPALAPAPRVAGALPPELANAAPALRVWWHTPARGPPGRGIAPLG